MIRRYLTVFAAFCILMTGCKQSTPTHALDTETGDLALTKDDSVLAVAYAVRDAVEAFALENNGVYPSRTWRVNDAGKTMKDYLPDAQWMVNPYSGVRYLPLDGDASAPGEVGYTVIETSRFETTGYLITAYGATPAEYLIVIERLPTH